MYLYLIGRVYWAETTSDFLIGKVLLMHKMMSFKVLVAFLALEVFSLQFLNMVIVAFSALGRNMTIHEFSNVQDYRHLFVTEPVKKGFDEAVYKNVHRKVPCYKFMLNPFLFFFSCTRKRLN